jgi:hypothetical protein
MRMFPTCGHLWSAMVIIEAGIWINSYNFYLSVFLPLNLINLYIYIQYIYIHIYYTVYTVQSQCGGICFTLLLEVIQLNEFCAIASWASPSHHRFMAGIPTIPVLGLFMALAFPQDHYTSWLKTPNLDWLIIMPNKLGSIITHPIPSRVLPHIGKLLQDMICLAEVPSSHQWLLPHPGRGSWNTPHP